MKYLILLATLALVNGQTDPPPGNVITCHANHTFSIVISNVTDITEWTPPEWRLVGSASCQPTLDNVAETVTYSNLYLPDCANKSLEVDNNVTITYVMEISVRKPEPPSPGQLRAYDHLYYAECIYNNDGTVQARFTPVVNKGVNATGNGMFTFDLDVFNDAEFTTNPSSPVGLDVPLYLLAEVVTQSDASNLDLFLVSCWASSSSDENSIANKVVLISNGCGDNATSEDFQEALSYTCTDNSVNESFSIDSFRYYGIASGLPVYFHCDLRVCLADNDASACECPDDPDNCAKRRKRRSVGEYVEEIHVKSGPYYFADDKKDEGDLKEQDKPQSFSTSSAIVVAVSSVVVVAVIVCVTVYLVVRSRNKRRQSNDLNVVT